MFGDIWRTVGKRARAYMVRRDDCIIVAFSADLLEIDFPLLRNFCEAILANWQSSPLFLIDLAAVSVITTATLALIEVLCVTLRGHGRMVQVHAPKGSAARLWIDKRGPIGPLYTLLEDVAEPPPP
jgi:hypothetical protein